MGLRLRRSLMFVEIEAEEEEAKGESGSPPEEKVLIFATVGTAITDAIKFVGEAIVGVPALMISDVKNTINKVRGV